ncbi:MAG: right-handed parallel beta-helix repeat-containing protein, partial [Thermoguttaceae bacterium]|nr:right-handed parallel beta-helix repeat-containing protein [Thermoguttaceae bacterium]
IATGNSGANVARNGDYRFYSYYSLLGDESATFDQDVETQFNVAPEDVFQYDEAGKVALEDGVPVISADGLAAEGGTVVGYAGAPKTRKTFYVDKSTGEWRRTETSASTDMRFELWASDYGLVEGTVVTTAANVDSTGAPASRFTDAVESKFSVGAYALRDTTALESVELSVSTLKVGDSVTATVSPEGATCGYQWYRVDGEGNATAIEGATSATFTASEEDGGCRLRVLAAGKRDYVGVVSAETTRVVPKSVVVREATQAALVAAINEVGDGGTVVFADELADSTITLNGSHITLAKNVAIDAGDLNITIDANEQSRIFYVEADCEVAINGLTLTRGALSYTYGAAICNYGSLTVTNSNFVANSTHYDGGAIANYNVCAISNSTFDKNYAWSFGGVIANKRGTCVVTDSTFTENYAFLGGAIITSGGSCIITGSTFTGNFSTQQGGGAVYNDDGGSLAITDTTFTRNNVVDGYGGAIYNYKGSKCELVGLTFIGNYAKYGGAIYNNECPLSATDCVFTDNTASVRGGAVMNYAGSCSIDNATFTNNSSDVGGAIFNADGLELTNSTFNENSADGEGGGIYTGLGGVCAIANAAFVGNSAASGAAIYNDCAVRLTDSTLVENFATENGGGIYSDFGNILALANSIVAGNSGGNIYRGGSDYFYAYYSLVGDETST